MIHGLGRMGHAPVTLDLALVPMGHGPTQIHGLNRPSPTSIHADHLDMVHLEVVGALGVLLEPGRTARGRHGGRTIMDAQLGHGVDGPA